MIADVIVAPIKNYLAHISIESDIQIIAINLAIVMHYSSQ
jgi:hypothetical protein